MKIISVVLFLIVIASCKLTAQNIFSIDKGNMDFSFGYWNNQTTYTGYPDQQLNISARQNFAITTLPFSIQGLYTNLNTKNSNNLYPNYINLSYNAYDFQKEMIERLNAEKEKAYTEEINKHRKKLQLLNQSLQIDSLLKEQNESEIQKITDEYKTKITQTTSRDSIEKYSGILNEIQEYQAAWDNLKKTKTLNDSLSQTIDVKDSIINNYKPLSLKDYRKNLKDLRKSGLTNNSEKVGMYIDRLNFGRFSFSELPFISQYSFVDGVDCQIKPSQFSLSVLYGKLKPFNSLFINETQTSQATIIGGSFGFSINNSETGIFTYNIGNNNHLIGASHASDWGKKINASFTIAGSQYNTTDADNNYEYYSESLPVEYAFKPDNYLQNILFQNKSFGFITGFALDSKVTLKELFRSNRIFVGYEYISPTYLSLASPFLIKDVATINIGAEQFFFSNKWKLSIVQRFRNKEISDWFAYRSSWQSTTIKSIIQPNKDLNLSCFYQYNQRNSENINNVYQILNANVSWTSKTLLNTTHQFQSFYIAREQFNSLWNVNYLFSLPLSSSLDLGLGYGTSYQEDNRYNSIKSELNYHPGKKLTHNLTGIATSDKIMREYYGGYGFRLIISNYLILEGILGYGKYSLIQPETGLNPGNNNFIGNLMVKLIW